MRTTVKLDNLQARAIVLGCGGGPLPRELASTESAAAEDPSRATAAKLVLHTGQEGLAIAHRSMHACRTNG